MSEPGAPEAPDAAQRADTIRRRARVGAVVDVVLLAVCAYVLASDAGRALSGDVRPTMRAGAFLLNLSATFVLVHRGIALVQRVVQWPHVRRRVGLVKWALAMAVPLLVAGYLEKLTHQAHRAKLDALVAEIADRGARALAMYGAVRPEDLATVGGPYLSELTVRTDTGAFLVVATLPALDVDGYTGRYSSTEGRWRVHHNDKPPERAPAFDSAGPLLSCAPRGATLRCERR